jgi:hypothetical protein
MHESEERAGICVLHRRGKLCHEALCALIQFCRPVYS